MEPNGGSTFSLCEEQTFSECALFSRKKRGAAWEGTARGQVFWRREISIQRTEMKMKDKRRAERRREEARQEKSREKTRREKKQDKRRDKMKKRERRR